MSFIQQDSSQDDAIRSRATHSPRHLLQQRQRWRRRGGSMVLLLLAPVGCVRAGDCVRVRALVRTMLAHIMSCSLGTWTPERLFRFRQKFSCVMRAWSPVELRQSLRLPLANIIRASRTPTSLVLDAQKIQETHMTSRYLLELRSRQQFPVSRGRNDVVIVRWTPGIHVSLSCPRIDALVPVVHSCSLHQVI